MGFVGIIIPWIQTKSDWIYNEEISEQAGFKSKYTDRKNVVSRVTLKERGTGTK